MGLIRPSTKIWNLKNTEKSVSDKNIKDTLIKKGSAKILKDTKKTER